MPTDLIKIAVYSTNEDLSNVDLEKILARVRSELSNMDLPHTVHYREES